MRNSFTPVSLFLLTLSTPISAGEEPLPGKVDAIRGLSPTVLTRAAQKEAAGMIGRDLRRRRDAVNQRSRQSWAAIENRLDWERYSSERLQRLETSLGTFPRPPAKLPVHVSREIKGNGFRIENLLYESRPGQWVPANLYLPLKPLPSMPGIILVHSHHRHRMQGELQDMGMTWARNGCMVLVIDQVGYGERRAHPFHSAKDYPKEYKSWRQDYYFRYDSGIQLQLAGDSLMGWMVYDLRRGVDLLLSRPGIDPKRIIILGAVAGGGDPAAITAALDKRISGAVPFNFGGAQPETRYPLPPDAEQTFNYLGGSYWESTRGLWRSGHQDFLHWVIVGSLAPRPLIYAHEFAWDRKHDPVWKRFQTIWGFYNARDKLAGMQGKGSVKLRPPQATHCTNIGKYHRQFIHPLFKKWFQIDVTPREEYSQRLSNNDLAALTPEAARKLSPKSLLTLMQGVGSQRVAVARARLARLSQPERKEWLKDQWQPLLGAIAPKAPQAVTQKKEKQGNCTIERIVLEVEDDIVVPLLLLSPNNQKKSSPLVVGLAQGGKEGFLKHRAADIAQLLDQGAIVCLSDLRGTGETRSGASRGRRSGDGNRSVNLLLYGETMLGQRLRDLRSTLHYLRNRKDLKGHPLTLWGDSFSQPNPPGTNFKVPRDVAGRPGQPEPLGGLLALLAGLYEKDLHGIYIHGGLSGFQSALESPHVYIPHDVVVPRALRNGDLCDIVAALTPLPICLDGLVDGLNLSQRKSAIEKIYAVARKSYQAQKADDAIAIHEEKHSIAKWLSQ